jgi:hypothetical protein
MMFEAQKEWICPENYPDLKGYSYVAIDLETKDPDLKSMRFWCNTIGQW